MSFVLDLNSLSEEDIEEIRNKMKISKKVGMMGGLPEKLNCYRVDRAEGNVYLPIGTAGDYVDLKEEHPNGSISEYKKIVPEPEFKKRLLTPDSDPSGKRRDQVTVVEEITKQLKKKFSCLVACCTGFGKTTIGTYLMSKVWGRKGCLVLCHLEDVREQWHDSIEENIYGMTVDLDPKIISKKTDITILGIAKFINLIKKGVDFSHIGMVIVDEMHLCAEATFFDALLHIQPYYLVGMSGTPDRRDGLDKCFELYFGSKKEFIVRKEKKPFKIVKVLTGYDVEIVPIIVMGKVVPSWSKIRESLEFNEKRHKFIVNLAKRHPTEKILIVSFLKAQSTVLFDMLDELYPGECVLNISGSGKIDKSKRIFICGMKKSGIGLDIPGLQVMIMASDTKDIRQIEGRMRDPNILIYDLVDNYSTLEKHWQLRKKWYTERSATITEEEGPDYKGTGKFTKGARNDFTPPRLLSKK